MMEEEMFFMLNDYIDKNFVLVRDGEDFCILLGDKVYMKMVNCKDVSEDFIKFFYGQEKEWIMEEGFEEYPEETIIEDMNKIVDEFIREGLWYWRNEVKEYKGHDDLLMALSVEES